MSSRGPFYHSLATCADRLPAVFADQFLLADGETDRIKLTGVMDRVWHRPDWLWPVLWLLTWIDLLFPETGIRVPASMTVSVGRNREGDVCHHWNRTFRFGHRVRRFNAQMAYDRDGGCVEERFIGSGLVCMGWDIRFNDPTTLVISTRRCSVRLGRIRITIPSIFHPAVRAVETVVSEDPGRIRVELVMTHPWLGAVFGYDGEFAVNRVSDGSVQDAS